MIDRGTKKKLFFLYRDRLYNVVKEYNAIYKPYPHVIRGKNFGIISIISKRDGDLKVDLEFVEDTRAITIKHFIQAIAWVEARIEGVKRYNENEYRKHQEFWGNVEAELALDALKGDNL
jgi:hypothetical protein